MAKRKRRAFTKEFKVQAVRIGTPGALTTEEREELGRLRRESRTLRLERDILRKRRPSSRRGIREVSVHRRGEG